MDGNGRWAKKRGLPRTAGHEAGEAALFDMVEGAIEFGVKELSAYAFSTENWKRSPEEVKFLMGFNRDVIRQFAPLGSQVEADGIGRRAGTAHRDRNLNDVRNAVVGRHV